MKTKLIHLLYLCTYVPLVIALDSVSIQNQPAYNEQRSCVKTCIFGYAPGGDLGLRLGCSPPLLNQCFCRADAPSRASSALSDCASSACTDIKSPSLDISSAISLYNDYCATTVGGPASNNAEPTSADVKPTSRGSEDPAITTAPSLGTKSSPGAVPYSTQPNGVVIYNYNNNNNGDGNQNTNSNVSKGGGDSLNGRTIAGIVVACTIFVTIGGLLGLWYVRKRCVTRKALKQTLPTQVNASSLCQGNRLPMAHFSTAGSSLHKAPWDQAHPHMPELYDEGRRNH